MVSICSGHCGRAEWLPQLPCVLTAMMAAAEHTVEAATGGYCGKSSTGYCTVFCSGCSPFELLLQL